MQRVEKEKRQVDGEDWLVRDARDKGKKEGEVQDMEFLVGCK